MGRYLLNGLVYLTLGAALWDASFASLLAPPLSRPLGASVVDEYANITLSLYGDDKCKETCDGGSHTVVRPRNAAVALSRSL